MCSAGGRWRCSSTWSLLFVIGFALFALLRYRLYANVEGNVCTQLTKTSGQPFCLKLGSHVFLWHKGALKLTVLVVLVLGFLDGVVLQSITGSTVGKYCTRLSVVDEHGKKAHPVRMFGRWVMLVIDLGFLLVGCIVTGRDASAPAARRFRVRHLRRVDEQRRPADRGLDTGKRRTRCRQRPELRRARDVDDTARPGGCGRAGCDGSADACDERTRAPGANPAGHDAHVARRVGRRRATGAVGSFTAVGDPARNRQLRPPRGRTGGTGSVGGAARVPRSGSGHRRRSSTRRATRSVSTKTDAEPEATVEAEVVDDGETDGGERRRSRPTRKPSADPEPETATEPEAEAEPEAVTETEPEPEVALELEADLGDDEDSTSQWKPVESVSKSRARSADGTKDDSWWDEALSSGDSESESDQVTPD